jgi:hypothetical protein
MPSSPDNITVDEEFDALEYSYENRTAFANDVHIKGERNLWCAVIAQAFDDLANKEECREAKRWLLHDKKDFVRVCSLAGLLPIAVRKAALKRMISA